MPVDSFMYLPRVLAAHYRMTDWRETYGPEVARKLVAEHVECVLLTPT